MRYMITMASTDWYVSIRLDQGSASALSALRETAYIRLRSLLTMLLALRIPVSAVSFPANHVSSGYFALTQQLECRFHVLSITCALHHSAHDAIVMDLEAGSRQRGHSNRRREQLRAQSPGAPCYSTRTRAVLWFR